MKKWLALVLIVIFSAKRTAQTQELANLNELRRKLDDAVGQIQRLTVTVEELRAEVARLKQTSPQPLNSVNGKRSDNQNRVIAEEPKEISTPNGFIERIIARDLGSDERGDLLVARPEIFIQSRYSAAPIKGSGEAFDPNFRLSRIEARWAGRIAPRLGAGMEIQFQEAIEGSPEELVNDAFLEYYISDHTTIRMGQFVKPFGFDTQQSSSIRESPERGIFSGYFFPGQRHRGIMLSGSLDWLPSAAFKNLQYFVGAFNGNRFFNDNNRQVNSMARIRKIFDHPHLVMGASVEIGKQLLPPGVKGNDNERLFGLDFQYAIGRFGVRSEIVTGNMPSTQVGIRPEFFPGFRPGAHSTGGAALLSYRIIGSHNVCGRYDQFNGGSGDQQEHSSVQFLIFHLDWPSIKAKC
jgi:hypothetical protein